MDPFTIGAIIIGAYIVEVVTVAANTPSNERPTPTPKKITHEEHHRYLASTYAGGKCVHCGKNIYGRKGFCG